MLLLYDSSITDIKHSPNCIASVVIIYIYIYIYIYTEVLDSPNVVYMFKCPLGNCVSKENNTYVDLSTTTLSRRLKMHLNDSSSIALHLKTHSIPKSKFRKVLVENTIIIAHEISKLQL